MQPLPAMVQEQPQEQPENKNKGPFPSSKDEALQFSNDILQVLYDENTHANIIKQLSNVGEVDKVNSVGVIAANTVGDRITDVHGQTSRPIDMGLTVGAVKRVVAELATMAKGNGFFEMSPDDEKKAIKSSIDILDGIEQGAK